MADTISLTASWTLTVPVRSTNQPSGNCGKDYGGALCNPQVGTCCSSYGYCGDTDEFCLLSLGCQSGCTPHSNLSSPSTTLVPSPTGSVSSSQTSSKSTSLPLLIGVTVGLTVLGIAIFLYSLYLYRHNDSSRSPSRRSYPYYPPSRQTAALDRVPKALKRGPMFIVDRRKYIFNIGGGNQASGATNHGRRGRCGPYDIGGIGHGMPWPDSDDHYGGGSTEYRYAGTVESVA